MFLKHSRARLLSAFLLLPLSHLGLSIPTVPRNELPRAIIERQATPFPASNVTPAALPTNAATDPDDDRTPCSPDECPQFCSTNNSSTHFSPAKRFLSPSTSLSKRFFNIPSTNPGQFVIQLLQKRYTDDLSPDPSKYVWHPYEATKQYASALIGLSGCTAIFITSPKGMFSAHIWEVDNNTREDLRKANYAATMRKLAFELAGHKEDLVGGDAFIILPTKTGRPGTRLYAPEIVDALVGTVRDGSGLEPTQQEYGPLNWKTSPGFGTYERGTAAGQYDPKYKDPATGKTGPAVRLWSENRLMLERSYAV
ncbi:MAG: hypothetical protein Q9195_009106 [Heterodermia aff. obscurata]